MDVRFVWTARNAGSTDSDVKGKISLVSRHPVEDIPDLLARTDGLVWVDIPSWDDEAKRVLTEVFCFHPLAIRDCMERNQVPKVHVYPGHVFLVMHAPFGGKAGHVHYIELDQFVGENFLVTVHGPLNPAVDPEVARVEVLSLLHRLEEGRLRPKAAFELSHGMVSALTGRLRSYTAHLTQDVWKLEQTVTGGHLGDPEKFLDELFRARHGLLTIETMASLSREVYARMAKIEAFGPGHGEFLIEDIVDQFARLRAMAHGQKEYLVGTIEFYQARTNTKMTIAAERLAVIAAVTLPITALSSILGMNLIVNDETHYGQLAVALATMLVISVMLLIWSKRKGWW
jgi:magnesium transporter